MDNNQKLLGYYNYTVVLTYIGMILGFIGITFAFDSKPYQAVICLMAAGFCDMFDGAIASTRKRTPQEKSFGIQIDSLSDLICFGILPAILVYSLGPENNITLCLAVFYALCALIRLAYFNVDEAERQKVSVGQREFYYGMPVTLSALFLPAIYGLGRIFAWKGNGALTAAIGTMAILFLLPFKLKKPKFVGKICVLVCGIADIFVMVMALGDV